jgi:hypothetical protein
LLRSKWVRISLGIAVAATLLGCGTGVVCDFGLAEDGSKFEISYRTTVDTGEGETEVKTVRVNEGVMVRCQLEEKWPECKEGAPEVSGVPVNLPKDKPEWAEKDENAKTVCVSLISDPQVKVTNSWFIGRGKTNTRTETLGVFDDCGFATKGQVARIKSEHHDKPSTFLCSVYIWEKGKKKHLDWAFGQAFSDCKAEARIP